LVGIPKDKRAEDLSFILLNMSEIVANPIDKVSAWAENKSLVNVIIDTPKDSRNKYSFDEKSGVFKLGGCLPLGHTFPFDFGYVPQTVGGDGDPLDVLVLMDEAAFVGCLVECRLIGGLKAFQTEKGKGRQRNDRLIGVFDKSIIYSHVKELRDLSSTIIDEIEHFFVSYNEAKGKRFKVEQKFGAAAAREIIRKSAALAAEKKDR
jgi:inorganic pyrophosphatase